MYHHVRLHTIRKPACICRKGRQVIDLILIHTPICHRLRAGPCGVTTIVYVQERKTFRGDKTPRSMPLFKFSVVLITNAVSTRRLLFPTAMEPYDTFRYPYSCSAATEYWARSPDLIRRDVTIFSPWAELTRLLKLARDPGGPLPPKSGRGQNIMTCFAVCLCHPHGQAGEVTVGTRCLCKKLAKPIFSVRRKSRTLYLMIEGLVEE